MEYSVLWLIFRKSSLENWRALCFLHKDVWYGEIFSKWVNVLKWVRFRNGLNYLSSAEKKLYLKNYSHWGYLDELCYQGDLETIQWTIKYFKLTKWDITRHNNSAFQQAAHGGSLNVLQWLTTKYELTKNDATSSNNLALTLAAREGRINIIKWLVEKFKLTKNDFARGPFEKAATSGHLEILIWAANKFQITKNDIILRIPWIFLHAGTHLNILQWLTKQFKLTRYDIPNKKNLWFCYLDDKEERKKIYAWLEEEFNL